MRKLIGIFMVMVLGFVFIGMNIGNAENPKNYSVTVLEQMVDEWLHCQKMEKYYDNVLEDGIYYSKGIVSEKDFIDLTGVVFSEKAMEEMYLNNHEYGAHWDITEENVDVRLTGFIDGYNVYILNMKSNSEPLGYECGTKYYQISIVFMVNEDC